MDFFQKISLVLVFASLQSIMYSQTPETVALPIGTVLPLERPQIEFRGFACADQFAGTVTLLPQTGQSNDMNTRRVFLCKNDSIKLRGNRDFNLTGDPQVATTPGIAYGFFKCAPSIKGPTLSTVLLEPCIQGNPLPNPPSAPIWVYNENRFGDATFRNSGIIQNRFNSDNPYEMFFAPITIDDTLNNGFELNGGGVAGPCVSLNTTQVFSIVYLNEITIGSITQGAGNTASFRVFGGLSQFNTSTNYTITIEKANNPVEKGVLTGGPYKHGDIVTFSYPTSGEYLILIEDGKSCEVRQLVQFPLANLTLNVGSLNGENGDEVCIPVTVENFASMEGMQGAIRYNASQLGFTRVTFPSPAAINSLGPAEFNNVQPGILNFVWGASSGINVSNGRTIFNVCFTIKANPGTCTTVSIGPDFSNTMEFSDSDGIIANVTLNSGVICANSPTRVTVYGKSCSTTTNDNMGSITIIAAGGAPPYNYTWASTSGAPSGAGIIATNNGSYTSSNTLSPGNYNVTVTDAIGITATLTIRVVDAAPIFVSLTASDPTCFGNTNGSVRIQNYGGGDPNGNLNIYWSHLGLSGITTISNLASGAYTVTIEDASGCIQTASTTIGVTPLVFPAPMIQQPSCSGRNDGSIRVTASGGKPFTNPFNGYRYIWQSKTDSGLSGNLTNVGAGTYKVTIQDANGCAKVDSFILSNTKNISTTYSTSNPRCYNDRNGSIVITPTTTGGAASLPYSYSWSPATGLVSLPGLSTQVNMLASGIYSITVTDALGCFSSAIITLRNPDTIRIFELEIKNVTCNGNGTDGKINASASGGSLIGIPPQYNFSWTGPMNYSQNGKNIVIIDNLKEGIYNLTITDDYGCKSSKSYNLSNIGATIRFDTLQPSCKGTSTGSINTTITYNKPYTVKWSNGSTSQNLNNIIAGKYYITITANDGCITIDSITLHDPFGLTIFNRNLIKPRCFGTKTGSISLTVASTFLPVTFRWSDPSIPNLPIASPVIAGTYYVTLTDRSNCPSLIDTIVLNDAPKILFNFTNIDSVSCYNSCDGKARLTPSKEGLTNSALYNFDWSRPFTENGVSSSYIIGLCPGYQIVQVTDSLGCRQQDSVLILAPTKITLDSTSIVIKDASCNGRSDGQAMISALGGRAPYRYLWPSAGNQITSTIGGLRSGKHPVSIIDSKGCSIIDSITVGQPDTLKLFIDSTNTRGITCFNRDDGQIFVVHLGGNPGPPIRYNWSPNISDTSSLVLDLKPNTYSVTITDSKGCTSSVSHIIPELMPIVFRLTNILTPICNGDNTNVGVVSANGGSGGPFSFAVDFGPQTLLGNELPISAGPHIISVYDINGCSADTSVMVIEPPALIVDLGPDAEIELGDSIQLVPIISSVNQVSRLLWNPTNTLNCTDPLCQSPNARPLKTTIYTLEVIDTLGCRGLDRVTIRVDKNRNVFIPNVFSPNRDGRNDYFEIFTGKGVKAIPSIQIFDRWGTLLLERTNLPLIPYGLEVWDGRFQGKDMQPGVYVYLIKVTFEDNQTLLYRGDVTIVK